MFDKNGRADIPRIMQGLSSTADPNAQQNAAAALAYIACKSVEYRDAIAAQLDAIIVPITQHLKSKKANFVHNAALLVGQCCASGSEFRQAFGTERVAALAHLLGHQIENGTICNILFALRQLVQDEQCPLTQELRTTLAATLPVVLFKQPDPRTRFHAQMLSILIEQRCPVATPKTSLSTSTSMPTQSQSPALPKTTLRRTDSLEAMVALAHLATKGQHPARQDKVLGETARTDKVGESFPRNNTCKDDDFKKIPPIKRRSSLLSSWKKYNDGDISAYKVPLKRTQAS